MRKPSPRRAVEERRTATRPTPCGQNVRFGPNHWQALLGRHRAVHPQVASALQHPGRVPKQHFGQFAGTHAPPPPAPALPPLPPAPPAPVAPPLARMGVHVLPTLVNPDKHTKSHAVPLQVRTAFAGAGPGHAVQLVRSHPLEGLGLVQTPPQTFSPVEQPFVPPLPA